MKILSPTLNINKATFKHTNDAYLQTLIINHFENSNENLFIVLPNLYEAQRYYDKLSEILQNEFVLFYPSDQVLTTLMALGSPEFKNERLYTLRALLENKHKYIIITTQDSLGLRQLKTTDYIKSVTEVYANKEYDINDLVKTLVYNGYKQSYIVSKPGEFSLRGSILDIFTHHYPNPYRLDFFGNELESIKIFDVETQRSFDIVKQITITPLSEIFFTDKQKESLLEKLYEVKNKTNLSEKETKKLNNDIEHIEQRNRLDTLNCYVSLLNDQVTTILNFSNKHKVFLIDLDKMLINEETRKLDIQTFEETMLGSFFSNLKFNENLDYILTNSNYQFFINNSSHKDAIDLFITDVDNFSSELNNLYAFILQYSDYNILISIQQTVKRTLLEEFIKEKGLLLNEANRPSLQITNTLFPGSFINLKDKYIVLTEDTIFHIKNVRRIRYRSVINQAVKLRDANELNNNDFVVHYDFGIGRFEGLITMDISGYKRDYLKIIYDQDEVLYVPTDQIDLVLKYRNHDDIAPKLSKLNSKTWSKTKASVKKRIKDLSDRLLNLYAKRNQAEGFAFQSYDDLMQQFESDFNYEETKDQLIAINKVKEDMMSNRPMDRLIAGDVGFGKTEVALRAAFMAVCNAKQVAYLVPTTVLARQHYITFKQRFEKYGASVALLSRFVTKKQIDETINKLKAGFIDVVIGTHRLLSNDIKFNDLGLFIIDEEQRFGVEHKERIKEMKVNVDTLTLSATPIPRTLQLSMYGLKDLSMIDTPPMNRYPVQTYVVPRHNALIKEAIEREIARGGQVFYLYNRVEDMEKIVLMLQKLIPNARISYAHGKMNKDKIEDVLSSFIDKEFDILISTTIIETGVDIPNSNTLIIHDADTFGLAQLYQLRGRVGRSDKIAYAYLMYDGRKDINDEAKKRLTVIEDFTDLGSGFKIALRDLSIRGAGDILGSEQSGFIDAVGIDLYMRLLDEVIKGIDEEQRKVQVDQVYADRHISREYIESDQLRIEIHKRIAYLNTLEDIENLIVELTDRFGYVNNQMEIYMYEKLFKKFTNKFGVKKINKTVNEVTLVLSEEYNEQLDTQKLIYASAKTNIQLRFTQIKNHFEIIIVIKDQKDNWLKIVSRLIQNYYDSDHKKVLS